MYVPDIWLRASQERKSKLIYVHELNVLLLSSTKMHLKFRYINKNCEGVDVEVSAVPEC